MGMDFEYAGSASYPRFDEEVYGLVCLFGGRKTADLINQEDTENERPFGHWFGSMSSLDSNVEKYVFPSVTNSVLVKWFNHIYDEFTPEETLTVYKELTKYADEVNEISYQIYSELKARCEYEEGWLIG